MSAEQVPCDESFVDFFGAFGLRFFFKKCRADDIRQADRFPGRAP